MTTKRIAVGALSLEDTVRAQQLALELSLPYLSDTTGYDYLLCFTELGLGLKDLHHPKHPAFIIDFTAGKVAYRSQQASLKNELLAKAIGMKPKDNPIILDVTAGLGRDSYILATVGFTVTMLEQSGLVYNLLKDGIERASKNPHLADIMQKMQLIHIDSTIWLKNLKKDQYPDVIYLDPMFPERKKSSSVKKEMVILQDLLVKDSNDQALFDLAFACAKKRVVVKRPRLAPNIVERAPNYTVSGKSSRFDIYLIGQG